MRVPGLPVPATRALVVLLAIAGGGAATAAPAATAPSLADACRILDPDTASRGFWSPHVAVSTASPWRATRGSRVRYVATARARVGSRRLGVCADRGRGTAQAHDLHARLDRRDRLVRAAVADPWVAWVTRRRGSTGHEVVHWGRLGGDAGAVAQRRVRGRVVGLVPTVRGRILVQSTTGTGGSRIEVLRRGRPARRLVLRGPGATDARRGRLVRWTPTDAAVTVGRRDERRRQVLPIDAEAAEVRRRCRTPEALAGPRLTTAALGVDLFAAEAWTGGSLRSSPSVERGLEVCASDGTLASAVLLTRDAPDHDDLGERGWADVGVAGETVVVREERVDGNSGTGTEARTVRAAFVRDGAGRMAARHPTLVVAGPAAAAFVERGELWVADADGLRRVAVAGSLTGPSAALRMREREVVARSTTGDQVVPVRPLPAGAFAASPFGTERAQDLAVDDVCGYELGGPLDRCRIPAAPQP